MRCFKIIIPILLLVAFSCTGASGIGEERKQKTGGEDRMQSGNPPGAEEINKELQEGLFRTFKERGPDYRPRTRHLRDDGAPKFVNRLIRETSPYLLQHAHNPVNWFPWGDEAFQLARKLGRPVFLSVGYSTCHWCHVMEEESFEDLEIARFINEHYIPIKVDREERPDVDGIYMSAVQIMTGRGGWPMSVWLTPDRKPFHGGTYFPARDGDRGARVGFFTILKRLHTAYTEEPDKVSELSRRLTASIRRRSTISGKSSDLPDAGALKEAMRYYAGIFDERNGGAGGAPKFPSSMPVRFLLRYHRRGNDDKALRMATRTLEKMAAGGMYDQVAGGFHRYSTDARWLVPHFEKMLYDNALLTLAYLDAYQATGKENFARVAREILKYAARDMGDPAGAFFSATDADSRTPEGEMEEGWFFLWTGEEIDAVLGETAALFVKEYYGVTDGPNYEGRNILHVSRPLVEVAKKRGLSVEEAAILLEDARERLYQERKKRPAPLRDEKILAAWNGLMISAFAKGGLVLGDESYTRRAEKAADFILTHLLQNDRLLRSYKDGRAKHNAYLDDYAFLIAGLLDLYEATGTQRWITSAIALDRVLDKHYRDAGGAYFMTSDDHEKLLVREIPDRDGAEPSGNSIQLMNLLRLHEFTSDDRYRQKAEALLGAFAGTLKRAPAALSEMLLALDFHLDRPKEIVIVTPRDKESEAEVFLKKLFEIFLPNMVLVVVAEGDSLDALAKTIPLVENKVAREGKATAYVCERGVCEAPTTDPATFAKQIKKVLPY